LHQTGAFSFWYPLACPFIHAHAYGNMACKGACMNEPKMIVGDVEQSRLQRTLRALTPKRLRKKRKNHQPKRKRRMLSVAIVVVLAGGTLGAYWYTSRQDKQAEKKFSENPTTAPENLIKFEPNDEEKKQLEGAYSELVAKADGNQATYDEYLQLAGIFQQQGDDRKALKYYELALTKISPSDPGAKTKRDRINLIITEIRKKLNDA